jgi:cytochrome c-type biogenesis protein CcmH/NrfG
MTAAGEGNTHRKVKRSQRLYETSDASFSSWNDLAEVTAAAGNKASATFGSRDEAVHSVTRLSSEDASQIWKWKRLFIVVILLAGSSFSLGTYFFLRIEEQSKFRRKVHSRFDS